MAYRLQLDGSTIECDTAEEAMALLRTVRESGIPMDCHIRSDERPKPIHPISPRQQGARVSNTVREFLTALKESYPEALTTDQVAARLGTTPKGLPAVVMGIRVLLRKWDVAFEDVIEWRKRNEGQGVIRQYRLTMKGMKILQERTSEPDNQMDLTHESPANPFE